MENRKVKNATPTTYNGINFRSKLEARFAKMLDDEGLEYKYEEETWELFPKFKYRGKTYRPITYTPDFIIGDHVVEIKGWQNDVYRVKKKLILMHIMDCFPGKQFHEVKTVGDMRNLIFIIKNQETIN